MDRTTRFIANRKQDKIRVVREQPSIQSMREGEEVLYFRNRGTLTRYRKERGKLWTSDMHGGRNKQEEGTFTASRLEYRSSFVDYRMFSHNFTDDLPATKIYIPWQGTGEQTSSPEPRTSFLTPFDMTCHKILIKIPEMDSPSTDIVFTIEKIAENDSGQGISTVATFDYDTTVQGNWQDDAVVTINMSDWNAVPKVSANEIVQIGLNPDNSNIIQDESHFIITSVWKTIVTI